MKLQMRAAGAWQHSRGSPGSGNREQSASRAGKREFTRRGQSPSCPEAPEHLPAHPREQQWSLRGTSGLGLLSETAPRQGRARLIPGSYGPCLIQAFPWKRMPLIFSFSTCPGLKLSLICLNLLKLRSFNFPTSCRTFVPNPGMGWVGFHSFSGCFPPSWDSHLDFMGRPAQGQELGSIILRVPSNMAYSGIL